MKRATKKALRRADNEMAICKQVLCRSGSAVEVACIELGYVKHKTDSLDWNLVYYRKPGDEAA